MDNLEDVVTAWREDALGITDYVPSERVKQISKLLQSSTQ
jgi:hypothetical protein